MPHTRDLALTGIPRSGTTLACTLINRLPQAVALAEPLDPASWPGDADAQLALIGRQFAALRERCLRTGAAPSRQRQGVIVDNFFHGGGAEPRIYEAEVAEVAVGKPLRRDFLLAVKQNAAFLALLPRLSERLRVVAIVRHPLAVLVSWSGVDLPVAQGRLPMAERMDAVLRAALDGEADVQRRQLHVLEWCYRQLGRARRRAAVLTYESMIASRGSTLLAACGLAADASGDLPTDWVRPPAAAPRERMEAYARALREMPADAAWRTFYGDADLHRCMDPSAS